MKPLVSVSVLYVASLLLTAHVRADVAPPDVLPCMGKAKGDTCSMTDSCQYAGSCKEEGCVGPDYANWNRDGAGPPTHTYICLTCMSGTRTDILTHSSGRLETCSHTATATLAIPTTTTTASSTATATQPATVSQTATATSLGTTTASGTDTSSSSDSSWCSIGQSKMVRKLAPWLLAGAFSLLFLWGRRRRWK
jgi:hypothetical protein